MAEVIVIEKQDPLVYVSRKQDPLVVPECSAKSPGGLNLDCTSSTASIGKKLESNLGVRELTDCLTAKHSYTDELAT